MLTALHNPPFAAWARHARAACLAGALALGLFTGCDSKSTAPAPVAFVDHDFGFSAVPPSGWGDMPKEKMIIPDKFVHAWTPDGASNIVAFIQGPAPGVTAQQVLASSLAAAKGSGWAVSESGIVQVAGHDAMSMKVVLKATGYSTAPGNVPTYQHWIAIPKQDRVLVLLLTVPNASKGDAAEAFETMVKSVTVE